jgi:hypothetical protein
VLIPPTCAKTEPQPKRTAAIVAIANRIIIGRPHLALEICRAPPGAPHVITRLDIHFAQIASICGILSRSRALTVNGAVYRA